MHTERIWAYSILIAVFLLAFINYLYFGERTPTAVPIEQLVTLEYRNPQSFDEIEPIDSLVKPILYSDVLFIEDLTIQEAKQAFINIMVPAILVAKEEIAYQREQVLYLVEKDILNDLDSAFLLPLFETYKTDDPNELIKRMRVHPTSIVLGQAAIESGWGKSRFFKEANNVFGVWSMNPNEPRIPAKVRREDRQVFLKRYPDISASIRDYFQTVGKVNAYREFRQARLRSTDYRELIPFLKYYSERGMKYVDDLERMIRLNDFEQYDQYQLDPFYLNID